MTTTNVAGWSPHGFDPEKTLPPWREAVIEACEFVADCRHQDEEAARLALFADAWLPRLRRPGFVSGEPGEMAALAEVVEDFYDYEKTNGRADEPQAASLRFAINVLYGMWATVAVDPS